jgi:hypothetical protein
LRWYDGLPPTARAGKPGNEIAVKNILLSDNSTPEGWEDEKTDSPPCGRKNCDIQYS